MSKKRENVSSGDHKKVQRLVDMFIFQSQELPLDLKWIPFFCILGLIFHRYLLWKLKKKDDMLSEMWVFKELEKIRVVPVKKGENKIFPPIGFS